jgi:hypothetical protein
MGMGIYEISTPCYGFPIDVGVLGRLMQCEGR